MFPTVMIVTDRHVTRIKASFVGRVEESISLRQISSVTVSQGAVFADVTVHSSGGTDPLRSHGHTNAEAKRLKDVIEELQTNILTAGVADVSGLRTCPRCAETIKAAAQVCRHCGADIPIELTEEAPPLEVFHRVSHQPASDEAHAEEATDDAKEWTWS
jgi:hypothetical protein